MILWLPWENTIKTCERNGQGITQPDFKVKIKTRTGTVNKRSIEPVLKISPSI